MIELKIDGKLATVALNRPAKANALTEEMLRGLTSAFDELAANDQIHAVILTGAGRVFSAGADLDEAKAGLPKSMEWERLSARVATMPCLTIAALNGTLAGGAFGMVLSCDLRIAVPEAVFFYPVMKLGYLPPVSDPRRMARLIGPSRTRMILMTGARISAQEALSWGLVDRLAPAQGLLAAARDLAQACTEADAAHVLAIKASVGRE